MHGAEAFCDLLGGSKGRALICELSTPFPHAQLSAAANLIQQREMARLNVQFSFKVQRAVERLVALSYPATSFHRGSALNTARPHESSTRLFRAQCVLDLGNRGQHRPCIEPRPSVIFLAAAMAAP